MNKLLTISSLLCALLMAGIANAQTCTNTHMAESTPTNGFIFSADGKTATNTPTGLTWKRCLEGQTFSDNSTPSNYLDDTCTGTAIELDWQAALSQAQAANSTQDSGYNDWRVPNLKELESIAEHCRTYPAINTDIFPGGNDWVWSSSPIVAYLGHESDTWGVRFDVGEGGYLLRSGTNHVHVRLVRSGQ